jgi:hypothetical protein
VVEVLGESRVVPGWAEEIAVDTDVVLVVSSTTLFVTANS